MQSSFYLAAIAEVFVVLLRLYVYPFYSDVLNTTLNSVDSVLIELANALVVFYFSTVVFLVY